MEENMEEIVYNVRFGANMLLTGTAIGLLISFPKVKAKAWLLAFLCLDLVITFYSYGRLLWPSLRELLYIKGDPVAMLWFLSWALLVVYVFAQRPQSGIGTPIREILFSFRGRISRQTYWVVSAILLSVGAYVGCIGLDAGHSHSYNYSTESTSAPTVIMYLLWLPVSVWISLATQVKRWHDRQKSGWMVLVLLIPIAGPLWVLVEQGFLKGTSGSNRYGEDPLHATGVTMRSKTSSTL